MAGWLADWPTGCLTICVPVSNPFIVLYPYIYKAVTYILYKSYVRLLSLYHTVRPCVLV